jgi:hypothetical protein
MSNPTYPSSLDVSAGQPTSYTQYNRLRADAVRLGANNYDAVPMGQFLASYISGIQISYLPTNRLRIYCDPHYLPTLMIHGYMCQATEQMDLPANSFSGSAADWYIFANRMSGSTSFTLSVNTSSTEGPDQRLIGSCHWDGTSLDATSIQTYIFSGGGSKLVVVTLHAYPAYTSSSSYNATVVCRQRLDMVKLKQGAKTAYLVTNLFASSGTAYARFYDTTDTITIIEISTTSTATSTILKSGDLLSSLPGADIETRFEIKTTGSRVDCSWAALIFEY